MSTYLLAIVVSDFKCKEGVAKPSDSHSVDIRVCARPNRYNDLDLAYDTAIQLSEFFENYYGIEYPLKKLGKKFGFVFCNRAQVNKLKMYFFTKPKTTLDCHNSNTAVNFIDWIFFFIHLKF
jgi:aminopeptidase N